MSPPATEALRALGAQNWSIVDALAQVPRAPGLYAVYGDEGVWRELGLGSPPDSRPLYVGKAEDSLVSRDLRTHFADGRTGSSTLRRSFAALLRDRLKLSAIPRNPAKPERFANYGLSPEDDAKLTRWMRDRLRLAVWPAPSGTLLSTVEGAVVRRLQPPLNGTLVVTPWTAAVRSARAVMASEARAWTQRHATTTPSGES
jgi:hypothetical protein